MMKQMGLKMDELGDIERVIGKYRLFVIVTLVEAHAASVPEVYRWYDFYWQPPLNIIL